MKPAKFLIHPARAVVLAALLALPVHAAEQFTTATVGGRAPPPICEYKGVMTDAEIAVCTGFRVRYNYDIYPGRSAVVREVRVTAKRRSQSSKSKR